MKKLVKILRSQKGQSTIEILVGVVSVAIIAVIIGQALKTPLGGLHDKTVKGIGDVTGSGQ